MAAVARDDHQMIGQRQGANEGNPPLNLHEIASRARDVMNPHVWDMYAGGSEDEMTLRTNEDAFRAIGLRPRVLTDVSACDTHTSLLGLPLAAPILIAPTSLHRLAHRDGECAMAQGAGEAIFTVSTLASCTIEQIALAATGPLWFQLYCFRDQGVTIDLVRRAEAAGYRAIVLTVDAQRIGNRERDIRNGFTLPPGIGFVNLDGRIGWENRGDRAIITWETVDWLRSLTHLPILLKGIMTAEDATLAVEHGMDGIIVSNHGGRQLDTTIPTIIALPEIAAAVAGQCEILLDGGVRRGTDIVKALALGAHAVLIGRPALWGLAMNGPDGVRQVLEILRYELELDMAQLGVARLADLTPRAVRLP